MTVFLERTRIFAPYLGGFYNVLMNVFEFLAVAVLTACVAFLIRRNLVKVPRFWSAEMTSWPRLDANLILISEIILMLAILKMNAADQILQTRDSHYIATGKLFFSSLYTPIMQNFSTPFLIFVERTCWCVSHHWDFRVYPLYNVFQAPSYFHGLPKHLLRQVGSQGTHQQHAGGYR